LKQSSGKTFRFKRGGTVTKKSTTKSDTSFLFSTYYRICYIEDNEMQ